MKDHLGFRNISNEQVMPGILWGDYCQLYTPAFWKYLYESYYHDLLIENRLGESIIEEVVACMLGGYGISSEMGIAAFIKLKSENLITQGSSLSQIYECLKVPFELPSGTVGRYRFARQKSNLIYQLLSRQDVWNLPAFHSSGQLRSWLLTIKGVGPKTASWITRNYLKSDEVAILDIHIIRACYIMNVFPVDANLKEYFYLESLFLSFCKAIDVRPSIMDSLMWGFMKKTNRLALQYCPT